MTPKISLAKIEQLAKAATPGPYEFSCSIDERRGVLHVPHGKLSPIAEYQPDVPYAKAKADTYRFLAACDPGTVQALIEDNLRMAKALEWEEHRCGRLSGPLAEALTAHRERFEE